MTNTTYTDLRRTVSYMTHRDTLSHVDTDRLPVFADMAKSATQIKAVSDEITARTSMHYVDYRKTFSGYADFELWALWGQYKSDTENLAVADELRSRHQ